MTEQTTETEAVLPPMFSALDRCDRCGAQAKARVLLDAGILLFCGHHIKKYNDALEAVASVIMIEQE